MYLILYPSSENLIMHITIAVINIKSNGDAITEAAKPKIPEPSKPGSVKLTRSRRLNKKTTTSNNTGK